MNKIILEGTDLIGKTTVAKNLKTLGLNILDRDTNISSNIIFNIGEKEINNIKDYIIKNTDNLFVFFYYEDKKVEDFLNNQIKKDEFDKSFKEYNEIYKLIIKEIKDFSNVLVVKRTFEDTPYNIIQKIISKYIENMDYTKLPVTLEGESKIYRRINNTNIAFATLKPSVYSFTHKRYSMVEGTDIARNKIWNLIGNKLNNSYCNFLFKNENYGMRLLNYYANELSKFKDNIFVSNFLINIDDKTSLVFFRDSIPNIEVVWKRKHYGTMKHKLFGVENFKTRNLKTIEKEGLYPNDIVRFDWRNPIIRDENGIMKDLGDECISDDFADFYINTKNSKILTKYVSWWLFKFYENYGLELIDLCYFQSENGDTIHSEISPDGMRLKIIGDNSQDYDKDLWRKGASKEILAKKWMELYEKLK